MALESGNHLVLRRIGIIAEPDKGLGIEIVGGGGLGPEPNARFRQLLPWEEFAGIFLARRRDIAVTENPPGWNGVAHQDAMAQRGQRRDLDIRKFAIAEFMPGIDQLDADGARVDI